MRKTVVKDLSCRVKSQLALSLFLSEYVTALVTQPIPGRSWEQGGLQTGPRPKRPSMFALLLPPQCLLQCIRLSG
jgi:hypothetical protein